MKKMKLTKEDLLWINARFGAHFGTPHGLLNQYNLEYALALKSPMHTCKELIRGHPFVDNNKKTALMVLLLQTMAPGMLRKENLHEWFELLLKDFADLWQALK